MDRLYASVRIIDAVMTADKEYLYSVPSEFREAVRPLDFVTVPFGQSNRELAALVVSLTEECDFDSVKQIISPADYNVRVSDEQYKMSLFISDRFFCTFGTALKLVLSPFALIKPQITYEISDDAGEPDDGPSKEIYDFIRSNKPVSAETLEEEFPGCRGPLIRLTDAGMIKKSVTYDRSKNEKNVKRVYLNIPEDELQKYYELHGILTPKQNSCLETAAENPGILMKELTERSGTGASIVSALVKKGILKVVTENVSRTYDVIDEGAADAPFVLSDEQQAAADKLKEIMQSGRPCAALLHGVTGSGKTKVMISAVKQALSNGKGAIVLTPEIGLSSQALSIFKREFGDKAAVIHSMLSDGERRDTYRRIEKGEIRVVLGTRSAVFAPMKDIGLIAIDEEQEGTYKSERTPKYHARDVARFRSAYHNALMLLASATPSVESMYKSMNGTYTLLTLKNRFNGSALPQVSVIDLRDDDRVTCGKLLSAELCAKLKSTAAKGEQAILYIGRRGRNSYISCRSCGYVYSCPNCSVSLTYHEYCEKGRPRLICHYCGYYEEKPIKCRGCGSSHIGYFGYGTQLLQDELDEVLGKGASIRMDADTTVAKHSHEELLNSFKNGEASVLFGTQMVAKGLDFPNVTLVGLVQTDSSLYMSDFRSSERTFSLITQLMGRSGRAEKRGEAVIQTYSPEHEVIKLGALQDYDRYFGGEIKIRKAVLFPPFCDLAVFSVSSSVENDVKTAINRLNNELVAMINQNSDLPFIKFGPCKEGIYKMYGLYRQRIVLKFRDGTKSRNAMRKVYVEFLKRLNGDVKLDIDINPMMV